MFERGGDNCTATIEEELGDKFQELIAPFIDICKSESVAHMDVKYGWTDRPTDRPPDRPTDRPTDECYDVLLLYIIEEE